MRTLAPLFLAAAAVAFAAAPDAAEIVKKSVAANEANWKKAPDYAFTERDAEMKRGGAKIVKTKRVLMIEGYPYEQIVAINDKPLAAEQKAQEDKKLKDEIARRSHESAGDRARHIAKYQKERQQDHALMREMGNAFDFRIEGEDSLNGHEVYVISATPKAGYKPKMRDAKVLTGMRGKLWIDKKQYQWVKVQAEVVQPVTFGGFIAKVGPGTKFTLEQAPVGTGLWLPTHFSVNVNSSVLWRQSVTSDEETYTHYEPMSRQLARVKE
ncbi:MAG TPA: hypothetical protein VMZ52_05310 [Bryobacteraceae bacterium]|nr:hypothetical protein [Bryobacteraceae bacterium]